MEKCNGTDGDKNGTRKENRNRFTNQGKRIGILDGVFIEVSIILTGP